MKVRIKTLEELQSDPSVNDIDDSFSVWVKRPIFREDHQLDIWHTYLEKYLPETRVIDIVPALDKDLESWAGRLLGIWKYNGNAVYYIYKPVVATIQDDLNAIRKELEK